MFDINKLLLISLYFENIILISFFISDLCFLKSIKISLSDTITRNLKSGRYGYDLLIQDSSGLRTRVIEGSALVTAGNTTSI